MKKFDKIYLNINNNKELDKKISSETYYKKQGFIEDAQRYIKAIKEGRMINSIGSVSKSGMSRNIKFMECAKSTYNKGQYNYLNFFMFFKMLGYTEARNMEHYFNIGGCGMDMIFNTNYTIIHRLKTLGFISKKQCNKLAQMTPNTI